MKNTYIITTAEKNIKSLISEEQSKLLATNILHFILGIFVSKGIAFGVYAPFGTAFLSAVPYKNMLFSLVGTIIGYILPSEINIGMRYISAAIAVCAIRWTLNDLSKLKENKLYAPIISFSTIIATGLAINISDISDLNEAAMYITEALLAAGAAYFFRESINIFLKKGTKIKQSELVCLCMTVFIVILSLLSVRIGNISIGKVLASLVIIFCSRNLGVAGGSISGITAGVIFGLAFKEPTHIMGAYAFGGLISGLMAPFGKISCCFSFLAANMIISVQTGNPTVVISEIYEIITASLIFIFLRDDIGDKFVEIFSSPINYDRHEGLKDTVAMRLDFTSKTLMNIGKSIDVVSEKLAQIRKNKKSNICLNSIDKVCNNCGLKTFCFDTKNSDTLESFLQINEILRSNGKVNKESFPENFAKRCNRKSELANNINALYREAIEKEVSDRRISEVREFVSEQFADMGTLLSEMGKEIRNYKTFDLELAKKITVELKKLKLIPIDVCCRYDKLGKIFIEIEITGTDKNELEKLNLSRKLSKICSRKLDLPCFSHTENVCRIQLSDKPTFNIQIGVAQHICKNGLLCGDNYTYFNNGMGQMVFILSDGMGTGGRAAVEGALACKIMESLIKSGMSFFTAAKITNSALRVKSEDEVLSTLDILNVNLFSGEIKLLKAGAPLTFLKKGNKVIRCAPNSLPIGILKEINVAECSNVLSDNDKILIVSDGAISDGDVWLEDMFKNWINEDSQSFANSVVKRLSNEKISDFDDDITVIAIKLSDNK